jgi:uncharacterized membrane protein
MNKSRMEAFSDGVIAILITIMVFEIKPPEGTSLTALATVIPALLSFLLSFLYLGIYWNNHHHLLQATMRVNGAILWANLHLLFWLALFPFTTAWLNMSQLESLPVATYGFVLLMAAVAYNLLQRTIIASEGIQSKIKTAIGNDLKGKTSLVCYVCGIAMSWIWPAVSVAIYVAIALMWLVPDRRIEVNLSGK